MIPLVKELDVDEINTSLIAIRKLLNNVGITETNITNIVGKDYDAKIQELEEKIEAYSIYSITEHWTGKYWIDGKPIYKRTIPYYVNGVLNPNITVSSYVNFSGDCVPANIDFLVSYEITLERSNGSVDVMNSHGISGGNGFVPNKTNRTAYLATSYGSGVNPKYAYATFEYTKTTD